jgi:ABC-type uncharacterized transport system auxiliary subunit
MTIPKGALADLAALATAVILAGCTPQPDPDPGLRFKETPSFGSYDWEAWSIQQMVPSGTPIPAYARADADRSNPMVRTAIRRTYEAMNASK